MLIDVKSSLLSWLSLRYMYLCGSQKRKEAVEQRRGSRERRGEPGKRRQERRDREEGAQKQDTPSSPKVF